MISYCCCWWCYYFAKLTKKKIYLQYIQKSSVKVYKLSNQLSEAQCHVFWSKHSPPVSWSFNRQPPIHWWGLKLLEMRQYLTGQAFNRVYKINEDKLLFNTKTHVLRKHVLVLFHHSPHIKSSLESKPCNQDYYMLLQLD